MDTNNLKTFYKHQLASLKKLIKDDARHCILTCPDIGLLTEIIDIIHLEYKESFDTVHKKLNPSNKFTNALLLIRMDDKKRIELQRQLYTIFELNDDNFAILYTNQVDCIDTMEKRVRSRYNNEYIHFPLFTVKNKKKPNEIPTPTLKYYITNGLATKYKIPNIKIADIYSILSPLHLSILILSRLHELNNRTIYENYQKFVIDTPALRKRSAADVINCFYDLQNLQLINKTFSGDWIGLKEYIKENSQIYLHLLLHKVNK